MRASQFQFQQFTIRQDHTAMKVGTDGVLLGALAQFDQPQRLLDIGCGTGLLALMLKQRYPEAETLAVEIDDGAASDAAQNFAAAPWPIALLHQDFRQFADQRPHPFDAIVCNPPYFADALKCPDPARRTARHTDTLPFAQLMQGAAKILTENGRMWVVIPPAEASDLVAQANRCGLYATRQIAVAAIEGQVPKRLLIAFERHPESCQTESLAMETADRRAYTDAYRQAVGPFYLEKYFEQKSR